MGISLKSQKILWGRAGGICSFPGCGRKLIVDATKADDLSLVGDTCHIVAVEPKGPRGGSPLTPDERNEYDNLILLCKDHHKMIDDQHNTYTIEVLHRIKDEHEAWVRNAHKPDVLKQRDDELYASYVDEWESRADLRGWTDWTSHLLWELEPWITVDRDNKLSHLHAWLLSRIWPDRYPELQAAFGNYGLVLGDLSEVFHRYAEVAGENNDVLKMGRFYKIPYTDPPLCDRLLRAYKQQIEMINDLTLELTRAANYVCDRVREFILPSFRVGEGALLVNSGFYAVPENRCCRPEYRGKERTSAPYPGLKLFQSVRGTRDIHFQWQPEKRS